MEVKITILRQLVKHVGVLKKGECERVVRSYHSFLYLTALHENLLISPFIRSGLTEFGKEKVTGIFFSKFISIIFNPISRGYPSIYFNF